MKKIILNLLYATGGVEAVYEAGKLKGNVSTTVAYIIREIKLALHNQ